MWRVHVTGEHKGYTRGEFSLLLLVVVAPVGVRVVVVCPVCSAVVDEVRGGNVTVAGGKQPCGLQPARRVHIQ